MAIDGKGKLKIVLISTGVYPLPPIGYSGLEQIVFDLAECLDLLGHEVYVVAPSESRLTGNIKLIDCGLPASPNAHDWEQKAYEKYMPVLLSPEFKDAIIHDHSWRKFIYLAKLGNPRLNVLSTLHGMLPYQNPPACQVNLVGLSKTHADQISGGLGIPMRYVYNGINLNRYKPLDTPDRSDRYLFLSRITPFKGAHIFIDLMRQRGLKGDLVGDDLNVESRDYVERCLLACNDYPDVRYWGGVSRQRAIEMFQTAKAYILPCMLPWSEPFGLTVIEAMACGCVPIATRNGAITEIIEHGISGYLADNSFDLTKQISDDNIKQIKPIALKARAEVFSRENMALNYLKLYNEILETGGW